MITPADFIDDAVYGLALRLKHLSESELYQELRRRIFKGLAEHEIGHSVGLTHNFAASADPLNYFPQYWPLREANIKKGLLTEEKKVQIENNMREYQYSSVMDYGAKFNSRFHGLGYYDKAAIKFGYGKIIETFEIPPSDALLEEYSLKTVLHDLKHYTSYPKIFKGAKNIGRRKYVLLEDLIEDMVEYKGRPPFFWEVPYRMCREDRVGTASYPLCNMRDEGADSFEIVRNFINNYKTYYIFRNFARGEVGFIRRSSRFSDLLTQYQNYFYRYKDMTRLWENLYLKGKIKKREEWTLALDGGLSQAMASIEGLQFLLSIIGIPEPGSYGLRDTGIYFPLHYFHQRWNEQNRFFALCKGEDTALSTFGLCADLNVPIGEGRYLWSEWDWSSGLNSVYRLKRIGAYQDRIRALQVLTYFLTNFVAVEPAADVKRYVIGYYQMWPEFLSDFFGALIVQIPVNYINREGASPELQKTLNEIIWRANRYFAWRVKEEKGEKIFEPPRPFTLNEKQRGKDLLKPEWPPSLSECSCPNEDSPASECSCEPGYICTEFKERKVCTEHLIYPRVWFSISNWAAFYAMNWFRGYFDQSFNDRIKIFCQGCIDEMELDKSIPQENIVECEDPVSRRIFVAMKPKFSGKISPGYELVKRCKELYPYREELGWLWDQTIHLIDFIRRIYQNTQYLPLRSGGE
jgi:hypothetical protein